MQNGSDTMRRLNELALQAGRKRISDQTGYVHLAHNASNGDVHYSIPLLENVLYALALFGSKSAENMLEARTRLDRLLCFQHGGNFPVYLHEYPLCSDAFAAAHVLPALYWILKNYGAILGNDLKERLERAALSALDHCLNMLPQIKVPDFIGIKISAASLACGALLNDRKRMEEGEKAMKTYQSALFPPSWFSPAALAELCTALQMVYPALSESPWSIFWGHLSATAFFPASGYGGPGYKELQDGYEPQVTLYDLFLGSFIGHFSSRSLVDHPCHLHAALIQAAADKLIPPQLLVKMSNGSEWLSWDIETSPLYMASSIRKLALPFCQTKEYHPFKIMWGKDKAHTFVCQGNLGCQLNCLKGTDGYELTFDLDAPFNAEDRDNIREIAFYFDYDSSSRITVDSIPATTFQLGQHVEWTHGGLRFLLNAAVVGGEGRFFGHVMRGNRPSQIAVKGSQRFNSYDWTIFLRTLSRSDQCKVKVLLQIRAD